MSSSALVLSERFYDGAADDPSNLNPIVGVIQTYKCSLSEAIHHSGVQYMQAHIKAAQQFALNLRFSQKLNLDDDEIAAIHFYTQPSPFSALLNSNLRKKDRSSLKPFLPFLRIFFSALLKLPRTALVLYRGVNIAAGDEEMTKLMSEYEGRMEKHVLWWGVSSCVSDSRFLESDNQIEQLIFSISAKHAVNIQPFSSSSQQHQQQPPTEWLLMPTTELRVKSLAKAEAGERWSLIQFEEYGEPWILEEFASIAPTNWIGPSAPDPFLPSASSSSSSSVSDFEFTTPLPTAPASSMSISRSRSDSHVQAVPIATTVAAAMSISLSIDPTPSAMSSSSSSLSTTSSHPVSPLSPGTVSNFSHSPANFLPPLHPSLSSATSAASASSASSATFSNGEGAAASNAISGGRPQSMGSFDIKSDEDEGGYRVSGRGRPSVHSVSSLYRAPSPSGGPRDNDNGNDIANDNENALDEKAKEPIDEPEGAAVPETAEGAVETGHTFRSSVSAAALDFAAAAAVAGAIVSSSTASTSGPNSSRDRSEEKVRAYILAMQSGKDEKPEEKIGAAEAKGESHGVIQAKSFFPGSWAGVSRSTTPPGASSNHFASGKVEVEEKVIAPSLETPPPFAPSFFQSLSQKQKDELQPQPLPQPKLSLQASAASSASSSSASSSSAASEPAAPSVVFPPLVVSHCDTLLFGQKGKSEGQFSFPEQVFYAYNRIYVCDSFNQRIQETDLNGEFLRSWATKRSFFKTKPTLPSGVAVHNNEVFVAENHSSKIRVVSCKERTVKRKFAAPGSADGQLLAPKHITIHEELLYVCDSGNCRVVVFDLTGKFVRSFGKDDGLKSPYGIAVANGFVFVSDAVTNMIHVFTVEDGAPLLNWAIDGSPAGLCVSHEVLYVCNHQKDRIDVFTLDGMYSRSLTLETAKHPRAVCVLPSNGAAFFSFGDVDDKQHGLGLIWL